MAIVLSNLVSESPELVIARNSDGSFTLTHPYGVERINPDGSGTYTRNAQYLALPEPAFNKNTDGTPRKNPDGSIDYIPAASYAFTAIVVDTETNATQSFSQLLPIVGADDKPDISGKLNSLIAKMAADPVLTGKINVVDPDVKDGRTYQNGTVAATGIAGKYGTLDIDAQGQWKYTLDKNNAEVKALGPQGTLTDTLIVTAGDGRTAIPITINVRDSLPTTVLNGAAVQFREDESPFVKSGVLTGTDGNGNAIVFPAGSQTSEFGTFTLAANGAWTYTLKNEGADVQSLRAREELTETIEVSVNGAVASVIVTITGVNDVPVVTGVRTAVISENNGSGVVKAEGQIIVTDKDLDESGVVAGSYVGQYGTVVLGADGRWAYTLDQSKPAVTALNDGASLKDTVKVPTLDGTLVDIAVDINGRSVATVPPADPETASLSGLVFRDANNNGIRDSGDSGIAGVGVELRRADGSLVSRATTDTNGAYSFTQLKAGQYVLDFVEQSAALNGLKLVAANQGSDDSKDSDVTNTAGNATGVLSLAAGQALGRVDVGYAPPPPPAPTAAVSGVLWSDTNGDGVRQAGETAGVAGVEATLRKASDNSVVATTTTGAGGAYRFAGVAEGHYYVDFDEKSAALAGKVFGSATGGDLAVNNDIQNAGGITSQFSLANGQQLANVDGAVRSIVTAATFVEDSGPAVQGGKLAGVDAAGNVLVFPAATQTGDYGTITLRSDGSWTYAINNSAPAVQALAAGDEIREVYTVGEGALATDIVITLKGSNDAPGVTGTQAATVAETNGLTAVKAEGTVVVTDVDRGQSGVRAGSYTGQYGAVAMDASGKWVYTLDQSKAAVAALAAGQTLTDTVSFQTLDGTSKPLAITIRGSEVGVTVADQSKLSPIVGQEDTALTLAWSQFGVGGAGTALGIKVLSLPSDGALQLEGKAVAVGSVISKAAIEAGQLKFVPDANESGADVFATAGVGNLKNDYAQFRFAGSDGVSLTAERTLTVDIRPVTDAPVWVLPSTEPAAPPAAGTVLYSETLEDGQAQGWRSYRSATPGVTERTEIGPESTYLGGTGSRPVIEVESDPGVNVLGTTLVTDPGQLYTFSVDYAARKGAETGGNSKLGFYVNGVEHSVMDTGSTTLTPFKFTFIGTGSDLLEFRSADASGVGGLVSNFRLVAGGGGLTGQLSSTPLLISSENFEDGDAQNWTSYNQGNRDLTVPPEIGPQSSYLGGSSTNRVLEVESSGNANALGRTFQTVAGADYRFSLDYAARQGAESSSKVSVYINGAEKAVMDTRSTDWKNFEVAFKGTGSDRVELRAGDANSVGGVVDNIKLYSSQPAPASSPDSGALVFTGEGTQASPVSTRVVGTAALKVPVGLVGSADSDGSESQKIVLKGLEPGYRVTDGEGRSYVFQASGGNLEVYNSKDTTGANWNLDTLQITPPADKLGTLRLVFEASSQDVGDAVRITPYYVNMTWSEVPTASVSGAVWVDVNEDKVRQGDEAGVAGVTAQLRAVNADGSMGAIVATTTTGANGGYAFSQQVSGRYMVDFDEARLPTGARFVPGGDTDISDTSNSGHTYAFDLTRGQALNNVDAAVRPLGGAVSGMVWKDANGDGIRQDTEAGLAGVGVNLRTAAGANSVGWTQTDDSGQYRFSDVRVGNYYVDFDETSAPIGGKGFSSANRGGDDRRDSDVIGTDSGWTAHLAVTAGATVEHVDAGINTGPVGSVMGQVWIDSDRNGVWTDGRDRLVAGVKAQIKDSGGQVLATTTTDVSGTYHFRNITAGKGYFIDFDESALPGKAKFVSGGAYNGIAGADNSGQTGRFDLSDGDNRQWLNARAELTGAMLTVSGHVMDKQNGNYPLVGLLVQIWVKDGRGEYALASTRANAKGDYSFKGVITEPGNYYVKFNGDGGYGGSNAGAAVMWNTHSSGSSDSVGGDRWRIGWGSVFHVSQAALDGPNETVIRADGTMYRNSPIAIDLDGDGLINTVGLEYGSEHRFDLLGTGDAVHSGWLAQGDGFLVIDTNHNGQIDSISEMFGGAIGAGFARLARYDSNGDGFINVHDADFGTFKVWVDANGDRITDAGELKTLANAGIVALKVSYEIDPSNDGHGNIVIEKSTALLADGKELLMGDVYFQVDSGSLSAANLAALEHSAAASAAHVATLGAAEQAAIQQGMADAAAGRATPLEGQAEPSAQHGDSLQLADLLPTAGAGFVDITALLQGLQPGVAQQGGAPKAEATAELAARALDTGTDQHLLAELSRQGEQLKAHQYD